MPQVTARDVMNIAVRSLSPETTLREATRFLVAAGISGAPVLNASGRIAGIFSLREVARHALEGVINGEKVGDFMTHQIVTVAPEATADEMVHAMKTHNVRRVFVESAHGELLGVVTPLDLLEAHVARARSAATA